MVMAPMVPFLVALDVVPTLLVPLLALILSFDKLCTLKDPAVLLMVVVVPLLPMPYLLSHLPHPMHTLLLMVLLAL